MSKPDLPESQFKQMLEDLSSLPPWVKEAMCVFLAEDLKNHIDSNSLKNLTSKDCLFLYVPRLTRIGQTYLENLKYEKEPIDKSIISFIKSVKKQSNMLDIAQDNAWTFKICCYYVIKAWEKNIILPTYSKNIYAMVRFLAGDIGLGDYLVRLGRITREQLNWVISMNKSGMMALDDTDKTNYEDIFVNLGYIATSEIVQLKQLVKFANSKNLFQNPSCVLIAKVRQLQQKMAKLEEDRAAFLEEKLDLERKVKTLNADIEAQKMENLHQAKEIELLKDELKKALKS
ncbi:MAG: hypothetical protein AB1782_08085 [Cyanobacteriota bacterium]